MNEQNILDLITKGETETIEFKSAFDITGDKQREERWDYPLEALREIVINMIVHRDYMTSSDSIIKVFDDRIEFLELFTGGSFLWGFSLQSIPYRTAREKSIT